ncbi:MAG TPA: hypothetical protein VER11_19215 [Polyangiaceae bacterium]|nr:hypothetical protein [Polyangiaceae bacterium]
MGSSRYFVALSLVGLGAAGGCANVIGLGSYSVADGANNGGVGTEAGSGNVAGNVNGTGGESTAGGAGGNVAGSGSVAGGGMQVPGDGGMGGVPEESAGAAGEGGLAGSASTGCTTLADCNDDNECTLETCVLGSCVVSPVSAGSACVNGVCNGNASAAKCVACADTGSGPTQDAGCTSAKPVCDSSGTPTCYQCNTNADCATDSVSCTVATCTNHVCSQVPTDSQCAASGDVCKPNKCDATLDCKQVDITALNSIISTANDGGNGGFEDVTLVTGPPPKNETNATAKGWLETGNFYIIYDCGSGGCTGVNGTTFPQSPLSAGGTYVAWTGSEAETELYRAIAFPEGTTKVQALVDINFQTESTAPENHDFFEVRLLDSSLAQIGSPLAALSNANGQTGTAHAWTKDGIKATRDVSALAGKSGYLMFWTSADATLATDFFFDNVRLIATVCK